MTVVTAIHWFDAQPFLLETRRVLQPGGTLAVLWTRREEVVVYIVRVV
jgi:ubiquinone/menaquinone biosynthesis C-methylase UbiE